MTHSIVPFSGVWNARPTEGNPMFTIEASSVVMKSPVHNEPYHGPRLGGWTGSQLSLLGGRGRTSQLGRCLRRGAPIAHRAIAHC